jgi:hypothetical protein
VSAAIQPPVGSRHVADIDLYAETLGGRLIPLGAMEERAGRWVRDWNTVELPDGDYGLVAIARHADGRSSLMRGGIVHVRNVWGGYRFVEPEAGDQLRGAPVLRLLGTDEAGQVS